MKLPVELKKPIKILLLLPILLLVLGIYHGLMQVLYRAGIVQATSVLGLEYYQGLTLHGVINAVLLTTYFAVALGHYLITTQLNRRLNMFWVNLSLYLMVAGTVIAAATILAGQASVLYTFYPPLMAHPGFYVGLTLVVIGSWVSYYVWIHAYLAYRRENPGTKTPLPVMGILASFFVWQIATIPVAVEILFLLLPWSLGMTEGVNALLARTLFWFFGHPLVYFWIMPIYVLYYNTLPKVAGGKLYSDFAGRFVMLAFCVLSAPIGLHHQFADPGISSEWKGLHTVLTSLVAVPSIMTAFTIAASLEYAARKRGGKGLFSWWTKLPYFDKEAWLFPYLFCGLIIFIFGGATGVVNASYNMNAVVHNTAWIPAHFHLTVAGPVFLGILGGSLVLLANASDKRVPRTKSVLLVPYLWTAGVMTMSTGQFIGGLRGEPRRTNLGLTYLNPESPLYKPEWQISNYVSVVGGIVMTLAFVMFFMSVIKLLRSQTSESPEELPIAECYHNEDISWVKNFRGWVIAGLLACVFAYYPPIKEILETSPTPVAGFKPNSPLKVTR